MIDPEERAGPLPRPARSFAMMGRVLVLRETKTLRDRMGGVSPTDGEVSTTLLGHWYANALPWRPQVAILINAQTSLPVLTLLALSRMSDVSLAAATLDARNGWHVLKGEAHLMAQSTNETYWLTARQVAEHYGVSVRTVDRWTMSGTLNAYRIGSVRRFRATDVAKMPRRIAASR